MKTLKLLSLTTIAIIFASCKASQPTGPPSGGGTPSLLEVQTILDTTGTMFLQIANETGENPYQAILSTAYWLSGQPDVQSATSLDSENIDITLRSGLKATFSFDPVDDSGYSLTRGGNEKAILKSIRDMQVQGMQSANTITNDSVLMFAAAYSEFKLSEAHMRSLFAPSPINFNVTVLKDAQCTYQVMQQFGNYGLVILDTHGKTESVLLGMKIVLPTPSPADEATFKNLIITQTSQDAYNRLASGDLRFISTVKVNKLNPGWQSDITEPRALELMATSQYIRSLPMMPNTVIFGNMCYSGWLLTSSIIAPYQAMGYIDGHDTTVTIPAKVVQYDPIGVAFIGRNPISYYGYDLLDGTSRKVEDGFAQKMEDTLVTNLVVNFDSTKIANLQYDAQSLFMDPVLGDYFIHSGADNYSYMKCGDTLLDVRDGQKYPTVCIGNQKWMAQNLNYNAPGSVVYNNDPANGAIYGRLYDWPTVMQGAATSNATPSGVQGVCPKGWHVPSPPEFAALTAALGGDAVAGGAMKSTSSLWVSPNTGATNGS